MGIDARWVCWTCKTYYAPGWRQVISTDILKKANKEGVGLIEVEMMKQFADILRKFFKDYDLGECAHKIAEFFEDLAKWLEKHAGHEIYLTSDHDESVDWEELERELL